MDTIDRQILLCLKENARESATNIGTKINLSTSAVIERIRKMEHSGLIERFTTIINQSALGRDLTAFIFVSLEHPKYYESFVKQMSRHDCISECYYIAGDFDFILKVVTKSDNSLETILHYVKCLDGVSQTRTSVVLSANKQEVCLLPDPDKK